MEESWDQLFKDLLQKKLHGTLTPEEEIILSDLAARKRGGGSLAPPNREIPPITMSNIMGEIDSLNSSFDEMAGKLGTRSAQADSRRAIADDEQKTKGKK
jgi:hypothetical protein